MQELKLDSDGKLRLEGKVVSAELVADGLQIMEETLLELLKRGEYRPANMDKANSFLIGNKKEIETGSEPGEVFSAVHPGRSYRVRVPINLSLYPVQFYRIVQ